MTDVYVLQCTSMYMHIKVGPNDMYAICMQGYPIVKQIKRPCNHFHVGFEFHSHISEKYRVSSLMTNILRHLLVINVVGFHLNFTLLISDMICYSTKTKLCCGNLHSQLIHA